MTDDRRFTSPHAAAVALLAHRDGLDWKEGGFLGHVAVADRPLSNRHHLWLGNLLDRAGMPPLAGDAA